MDLWIEITKLFALHEACKRLQHGVKESRLYTEWKVFSPTRFIYSYFTFNSIFNYDWRSSLQQKKAINWIPDESGRFPKETDQIKRYVKFCRDILGSDMSKVYADSLHSVLTLFGIQDPHESLLGIRPLNETPRVRRYRKAFLKNFAKLHENSLTQENQYSTMVSALMYVYAVRNNVFHGSKTRIEMEEEAQQKRLLIYSALLVATNSLLFEAIDRTDTKWNRPSINLTTPHLIQTESASV